MTYIEIAQWKSELDYQFELANILVWMGFTCKQNCTITMSLLEDNKYEYYKDKKVDRQTRKKFIVDILAIKWNKSFIVEMKKRLQKAIKCKTPTKMARNIEKRCNDTAQVEKYKKTWLPVFLCYWREWFDEIISYANTIHINKHYKKKFTLSRRVNTTTPHNK